MSSHNSGGTVVRTASMILLTCTLMSSRLICGAGVEDSLEAARGDNAGADINFGL